MSEQRSDDDEALMERYKKGDSEAFEQLFDRYEERLKSFLRKRLPTRLTHDLEDFFQMTWLKIHDGRSQFKTGEKFAPWFYTIALNTIRDRVRSASFRRENISFEDGLYQSDRQLNAESQAIQRQEFDYLARALQDLSDCQREIILLSDWEGFGSKEIGGMLSLKDATVRQHLSRARQILQKQLKGVLR